MKDYYVYLSIFEYTENGIGIYFPDLPGAVSFAENEEEAFKAAKECLELHLYGMEEEKEEIPAPCKIKDIKLEENEVPVLIKAFMKSIRDEMQNKLIKKTLTIPKWINDLAVRKKINFSQVLQEVLKDKLEVL
ncbi:type II toxin-antitoxin system HicB family antitoxin [Fusobacterium varium]